MKRKYRDGIDPNDTHLTLVEQMRITDFEIASRKELLSLTEKDFKCLGEFGQIIEQKVDKLVDDFYETQVSNAEIALLIGDGDTLSRLANAQRHYVLDLFSGVYDMNYVNNRLRIGMVHKRIGVEPKLYLSAVNTLKSLLYRLIQEEIKDTTERRDLISAFEKLLLFDITLIFETYIRSLVTEIQISKEKSERYATSLEEKVRDRTKQLEETTRLDALTGLNNIRYLKDELTKNIRACERRNEPISMVYIDVDDFKQINDTYGHQRGDEVLKSLGKVIKTISRTEDNCFRYGGDEFCLILPNCNEENARLLYFERLKKEFMAVEKNINLSIGIYQNGTDEYYSASEMIRKADELMYAAKKISKVGDESSQKTKNSRS